MEEFMEGKKLEVMSIEFYWRGCYEVLGSVFCVFKVLVFFLEL